MFMKLAIRFEPKAVHPTPGAGDFCLVTAWSIAAVLEHLEINRVIVELGPVRRNGARGPMTSVYFRDPNHNLVEVSCYDARWHLLGSPAK
jgi:catechol 2,3-dioxygenase-like lactoylglutathione lyase family enzyme